MPAFIIRAPGRVNLIGEHTDYNDGFVLPMAINRAVWLAFRPRYDRQVVVHSLDFDETDEFHLDQLTKRSGWLEYLKGVVWALTDGAYQLLGWEGVMGGDIPIGAGLSSSAAVQLATARAFSTISRWHWEPQRMAKIAQRAEQEWLGVQCGIMDQMVVSAGIPNHALLIDCRSYQAVPVKMPADCTVVILDSNTRRKLVDSAYNQRQAQCQTAAQLLKIPSLRDMTLADFNAQLEQLPPLIRKRARHVISENERTIQASRALRRNDLAQFGTLMNGSHASLRDDFEVSCPELDSIVTIAQNHPACYGARMTGAGFGGCAVALVRMGQVEQFVKEVREAYLAQVGLPATTYISSAAGGVALV